VGGNGTKLEPSAAAYANAAASMAHDWDDYLYMGHTGHSAVWSAWALAQAGAASAYDALAAQIAANEVEGRLGAAVFLGPQNGQLWSWIHCAGAAVAAGRLRGLDPERLAHALAISLSQPPYGLFPAFMGPGSKLLTAAEPTAAGMRAAALAEQGLTGPLDVIEDRRGLLAHLAFAPRPSMLGALGRVWLTDTLAFKPLPGCAYLQPAVEAALRLREDEQFDARDVASVDAEAGFLTVGMERLCGDGELTPVRTTFSVALGTAVALIAGSFTPDELDPSWLGPRELEIRELAARVRVAHDPELSMRTVAGNAQGLPLRAALGEVSRREWRLVRRRMRELGMDEASLGPRELAGMLRAGVRNRGEIPAGGDAAQGLAAMDTTRLRLTFPTRLRVRLRSGRVLETEGREPGACGTSVEEQGEVVAAKWARTGGSPERLAELTGISATPTAPVPA
jgi:2-methylcitrate dehydratase PrpD